MQYYRLDKRLIRTSFSKWADKYDYYASLQLDLVKSILPLCWKDERKRRSNTILDIGSGTGNLTLALKDIFPMSCIIGCDISDRMNNIALAKVKGKGSIERLYFLTGDAESLPFSSNTFELIASNLALQWVPDIYKCFMEIKRVIKPHGQVLFSTLGEKSLKELRLSYQYLVDKKGEEIPILSFHPFSSEDILKEMLLDVGFKNLYVTSFILRRYYPDLKTMLRILKFTGARGINSKTVEYTLFKKRYLLALEEIYKAGYHNKDKAGSLQASYQVILFSAEA